VRTWEYLTNPDMARLFWPGVITGLAVGLLCAVLSVLVVLKRMSFIGQGISHAAFGGVGVAALIAVEATGEAPGGALQFWIVLLFCLAAALVIAWLSERGSAGADTAIGIVLVASMAAGAILIHRAWQVHPTRMPSWESVLFGAILAVDERGAWTACGVAAATLGALWWFRRPMLFWAFDEPSAPAFGVPARSMKVLLVVLLTLAIVTGMKLVGVVLATALLVLPGATALLISDRLWPVIATSAAAGVVGVAGGLVLSFEQDWPSGPSIVAVLTAFYAGARLVRGVRAMRSAHAAAA
jgi:ABC-type Mn2+/Zn2+ transport system permease subunit